MFCNLLLCAQTGWKFVFSFLHKLYNLYFIFNFKKISLCLIKLYFFFISRYYFDPTEYYFKKSVAIWMTIALIVGVFGTIGDLIESKFK